MRVALPDGVTALDGTAESIPLEAGSVDAVTIGQAFHWFNGDAALAEIYRVLRPGGSLALVFNRRGADDPVNQAFEALVGPYRPGTPAHSDDAWRFAFERTRRFGPLDEELSHEQTLDADGMADRVASISFISALPESERRRLVEAARAIAAAEPGHHRLPDRSTRVRAPGMTPLEAAVSLACSGTASRSRGPSCCAI